MPQLDQVPANLVFAPGLNTYINDGFLTIVLYVLQEKLADRCLDRKSVV